MKELISIELNNVRFHAYHGLFSGERKTGNEFEVNLRVDTPASSGTITSIKETINYVSLYEIIYQEMKQPRDLLETLVMQAAEKIHQSFPSIKRITLKLTKLNPAISQFTGHVSVTYNKEY